MWTKEFASKMGRLVVRGLVRWLEMLGENPPLSRDHAFLVWQTLHQDGSSRKSDDVRPGGPGRDRDSAPLGWFPPIGSIGPQAGPIHPPI